MIDVERHRFHLLRLIFCLPYRRLLEYRVADIDSVLSVVLFDRVDRHMKER
jgi:hypothetical protein